MVCANIHHRSDDSVARSNVLHELLALGPRGGGDDYSEDNVRVRCTDTCVPLTKAASDLSTREVSIN